MAKTTPNNCYVIYGGNLVQERSAGNVVGWKAAGSLVEEIRKRTKVRKKKKS